MSTVFACPLSQQLIRLTGKDKLAYLHGQITQDINKLSASNYLWGGHCNAKGKLWAVFKLFLHQDSYYLVASEDEIAASLPELKKYAVFSQVEIEQADNTLIGLVGDDLSNVLEQLSISFTDNTACDFAHGKALKLANNRVLLMVDNEFDLPQEVNKLDDDSVWQQLTIAAGEPQLNADAIGEYVPQMVNLQAIGGISFKKGCYTGQETVARMKYLGKNKRAMFVLSGTANGLLDETDLESQVGDNWRRAGKVIQQSYNQQTQTLSCLAVLPNDLDAQSVLRAKISPEVELTIQPLPYSLDEQ